MGKSQMIGGCLVAAAIALQACRPGMEAPVAALRPPAVEEAVSLSEQSTGYYYYAAAQVELLNGELKEAIWLMDKAVTTDPASLFLKVELAELLSADGNDPGALALIKAVLDRQSDHIAAITLAGKIYQQRRDLVRAKQFYESALRLDPADQNVYILLGRLYWNENDLNNARRVFERMAANLPDAFAAHYFLGKVYASQGNLDLASAAFQRALALDPSLEEARLELIEIYKAQGNHDKVIDAYLDLLDYHPDSARASLALAVYYHQVGRSSEAEPLLAGIGQQSLDDPSIVGLVFDMFLETKQYPLAGWVIEGMLAGAPESADLHYLSGAAHDAMNHVQDALAHFKQVTPGSRFYSNAVINGALLYYHDGDVARAADVLERALALTPHHVDFYFYLGTFYSAMEQLDRALAIYQDGLAIQPDNVRLQFQKGMVLDKLGRRQEAITVVQAVVRQAPDYTEALNYLGYTYAELGIHLDEAEQLIRAALKRKPGDGYITDSLGWVFYKRGQYNAALEWLLKALAVLPNDSSVLEHVGDVYLKLEQPEQAMQYYQRAVAVDPEPNQILKEKIDNLMPTTPKGSPSGKPSLQTVPQLEKRPDGP